MRQPSNLPRPPSIGDVVRLRERRDINGLVGLLHDGSMSGNVAIRGAAARALGDLKASSAVGSLARLLVEDDRVDVRAQGATAIGAIGSSDCVGPLIEGLGGQHDTVRIAIVNALGQLRSPDALPTLLELLHDRSTTVRSVAARAIGAIGTWEVIPRLVDVAASDRMMVRTAAVDAIAGIGGTSAIDQLRDLRKRSHNPIFRRYVGVELKRLEHQEVRCGQ